MESEREICARFVLAQVRTEVNYVALYMGQAACKRAKCSYMAPVTLLQVSLAYSVDCIYLPLSSGRKAIYGLDISGAGISNCQFAMNRDPCQLSIVLTL